MACQFPAMLRCTLTVAVLVATLKIAAAQETGWRDGLQSRLEALALLQSLNADLLSHDSATLTLDRWCSAHRLADPAVIVADLARNDTKPVTQDQRKLLGVSADEPVRYRHVRLRCGARILSDADNWYVPSRLTPKMNHDLETSDIAFGRAVRSLGFQRHTLAAALLWLPLPAGWEMGASMPTPADGPLRVPDQVIQHRAVLTLPNGTPFSEVVETYTGEVLAIPEPRLSRPPDAPRGLPEKP